MAGIEFAYLLIAVLGIIILVMLIKYLKLAKTNKKHESRIRALEGQMELMIIKITPPTKTIDP